VPALLLTGTQNEKLFFFALAVHSLLHLKVIARLFHFGRDPRAILEKLSEMSGTCLRQRTGIQHTLTTSQVDMFFNKR